ncbi:MAG: hypothetical protein M3R13_04030 [Armatimonadota bacterium]|nr:hypothetical protein [Armatimonadota bacterium]
MANPAVTVSARGSPALLSLLKAHPLVVVERFEEAPTMRIEFSGQGRHRIAYHGNAEVSGPYGLTELMDNNPLVCADLASVTGPEATLALVALGPLAKAELLIERPAIAFNFSTGSADEVDAALATEGWTGGASVATSDEAPDIFSAQCIAQIRMPRDERDLTALYEECFGRSFFVRASSGPVVVSQSHATYALSIKAQGDGTALATVFAHSARNAKCGAGGLVHLFNVMASFEESLGVAGFSPSGTN